MFIGGLDGTHLTVDPIAKREWGKSGPCNYRNRLVWVLQPTYLYEWNTHAAYLLAACRTRLKLRKGRLLARNRINLVKPKGQAALLHPLVTRSKSLIRTRRQTRTRSACALTLWSWCCWISAIDSVPGMFALPAVRPSSFVYIYSNIFVL